MLEEKIYEKFMEISDKLVKENNYDRGSGYNVEKTKDNMTGNIVFTRNLMFGKKEQIDEYKATIITDQNFNIISCDYQKITDRV